MTITKTSTYRGQVPRNFSYFEDTAVKLNHTNAALAVACGYSKGSCWGWKKAGKIPTPLALACECLLRRQKKEASLPAAQDMYVLLVSRNDAEKFADMCKVFNAEIRAVVTYPARTQ